MSTIETLRSLLVITLLLVASVVSPVLGSGAARADSVEVAPASVDAGCLDPGATMYARVIKPGVGMEQLYILDGNGDGLPNAVYCAGGTSATTLSPGAPSAGSTCSMLQTITPTQENGCDFQIKVYMGSASNDNNGSGNPIDCSAISDPMLFFGGGGNDKFIGTAKGDFENGGPGVDDLDGDAGDDFLCGGPASGEDPNIVDGGADNDLAWGGPDYDQVDGGPGEDLAHGGVSIDDVSGGDDPDYVFGGSDLDTCDGGGSTDSVHTGESDDLEFVVADDSADDVIFAADDYLDDIAADGSSYDRCLYNASDYDYMTCFNPDEKTVCTADPHYPFLVATFDGNDHELFELGFDGTIGAHAQVYDDGLGIADRIVSLAVDPDDCDGLTALVVYCSIVTGCVQYLAPIDLGAEPSDEPGYGDVYHTLDLIGPLGDTLVDIAFDFDSTLGGLTTGAEFVEIDTGDGTLTSHGIVGPNGTWDSFEPEGFHMAFDDPDGGLFVALTKDPNPNAYAGEGTLATLTAYHYPTQFGTPMEDHIFEEATMPFTVTNKGYGHFFTLGGEGADICDPGEYPYLKIRRRNWEVSLWQFWGCEGTTCCASLGEGLEIDAVTIPHYIVEPA